MAAVCPRVVTPHRPRRPPVPRRVGAQTGCAARPRVVWPLVTDLPDVIEADLDVGKHDLTALYRYLQRGPASTATRRRVAVMFLGAIAAGLIAARYLPGWPLVAYLAVTVVVVWALWRQQQAGLRLTTSGLCGRLVAQRDAFFIFHPSGVTSRFTWGSMVEFAPANERIFIKVTPQTGIVVPRRCFADGDDERFLDLARAARTSG